LSPAYPKHLKTLGDHLRKNRLDKKLLQREVGRQLGVEKDTVTNWETNRTSPSLSHIPKIIKFIGYIPWETSTENIKMSRQLLGISQEFLAKQIGVDPGTLARWETAKGAPSKKQWAMIDQFLASLESNF
jgi:transcriptional regulator with XRE-family HTH domain